MISFKVSQKERCAQGARRRPLLGCTALFCTLYMLGVASCEPSRDQGQGSRTVPVTFPAQLQDGETPLRYAVVWTTASEVSSYYKNLVTVSDGPVDEDTFNVTFTYPQDLPEPSPTELLYFSSPATLNLFRPRLVLYEDANGNEAFDPGLTDAGSHDVVVALDSNSGTTITAIPQLREQISALAPEQVQEYYANTGNRLIPFILTDGSLGYRYFSTNNPSVLSLQPFGATTGLEDLRCGRASTFNYFSAKRSIYLDENVDALALSFCAQSNACQEADFATLPLDDDRLPIPPKESAQGTTEGDGGAGASDAGTVLDAGRRDAGGPERDEPFTDAALGALPSDPLYTTTLQIQCRRRGGAVALVLIDPLRTTCQNCLCSSDQVSYVANPQTLPTWWPCGRERPYCDGTNVLTDFDANCPAYELAPSK